MLYAYMSQHVTKHLRQKGEMKIKNAQVRGPQA